jgi:hypothetical protein
VIEGPVGAEHEHVQPIRWAASPVVAVVPGPTPLRYERALSEVDVKQYAAAARMRLRLAA